MLILTESCEAQLDLYWDVNRPVYELFDRALNELEAGPNEARHRKYALRTDSGLTYYVIYVIRNQQAPSVIFWRPTGEDVEVFWLGQLADHTF